MKLTLRKKNKVLWIALFVVGLVAVGSKVDAQLSERSLKEQLSKDLAAELAPEVKAALLGELSDQADEVLGLSEISASQTGLTNLRVSGKRCNGSSSSTYLYHCQQEDIEVWPTGTTSLAFRNNRSTTTTMERLMIDFSGTASQVVSSSVMFSCGTSSVEAVAYNAAVSITPRNIFSREAVVTGTQPVFDSLILSSSTINNGDPRGRGFAGTVLVGPNQYISCTAQAYWLANGVCDQNGVQCEAPTSSNRGWVATVRLLWGWVEGI